MNRRSRDDILHVAELARLEISESEIEARLKEFNDIVLYIEKLNEVPTDGVEPTFQVGQGGLEGTPLAADEPIPSLSPEHAVRNAPQKQDSFFVVPRVFDNGDEK